MRNFIALIFMAVIYGCSGNQAADTNKQKDTDSVQKVAVTTSKTPAANEKARSSDSVANLYSGTDSLTLAPTAKEIAADSLLYQYKDDTLKQNLTVKFQGNKKFYFVLESVNKAKGKSDRVAGFAILPNDQQDTEEDNDDEGMAYPSYEYTYQKGTDLLSIRVGSETKDKIQIKDAKVKNMTPYCPFNSVGVLKFTKSK